MASETEFDLNLGIRRWRETLAGSPAVRPENLDELEIHLRDSVSQLQSKGLSDDEAFLIAVRRIGQPKALEQEFKKLNVGPVWLSRLIWAVTGILLSGFALSLAGQISQFSIGLMAPLFAGNSAPLEFPAVALLILADLAIRSAVVAGIFAFLWRLTVRQPKGVTRFIAHCLDRPVLAATALLVLGLGPLAWQTSRRLMPFSYWPAAPQTMLAANCSIFAFMVLETVILSILLVWLARRQMTNKGNSGMLGFSRLTWAVVGVLSVNFISPLAGRIAQFATWLVAATFSGSPAATRYYPSASKWLFSVTTSATFPGANALFMTDIAVRLMVFAVILAFFWRLIGSEPARSVKFVTRSLERPVLSATVLAVMGLGMVVWRTKNLVTPLLPFYSSYRDGIQQAALAHDKYAAWLQIPPSPPDELRQAILASLWSGFGFGILQTAVLSIALVWLARRHFGKSRSPARQPT